VYERWTTANIAPERRRMFWAELMERALVPLTPRRGTPEEFGGEIDHRWVDRLSVNRLAVTFTGISRTPDDVARTSVESVIVHLITGRRGRVRQCRSEIHGEPGDLLIYRTDEPFEIDHPDGAEVVVLTVPVSAVGRVQLMRARKTPSATLLAAQMRALALWRHDIAPEEALAAFDSTTALVRAVAAHANGTAPSPLRRSQMRSRLRAIFARRAAEPGFAPEAAASELGISVRTLHAWLAHDGTRFGAELLAHRLERARAMLGASASPATIAQIAVDCGFASPAHLSRRFRERYGVPPSQWPPERSGGLLLASGRRAIRM
jgi:AraC-like DNA-binding protein